MQFRIECRSKVTKALLEFIMPGIIDSFKLNGCKKSVHITVTSKTQDCGNTVVLPGLDIIFVCIKLSKNITEVAKSLVHEMVHVKQLSKGTLRTVKGGYMWANRFFPSSTEYLDRPWEVQAFQLQEIVLRKVLKANGL
jgi:hypothetical protein